MKFHLNLIRLAFKQQLTYRTALVAGLATNLFFGLLRAYLLIALYNGRSEVNQLSLPAAITYVGFSQALIAFLTIFGSFDLIKTVITGEIAGDLLKPANFFTYWLARDLGRSLVNLIGRGILFIAIFGLFYRLLYPTSVFQWSFLLLSAGLSWVLSFTWRFLVNLAAFWSPDAQGIGRVAFIASQLFSGFIMPLRLLPDWFNHLCQFTPYPSMINTPVEIYLGVLNGPQAVSALLLQLLWCFILIGLSNIFLHMGVRRLVIQGG